MKTLDKSFIDLMIALRSFDGETTADGNVGGTTLINANDTHVADFWNGLGIIIASGAYMGQVAAITDWAVLTGTLTVTPALGGKILAGTRYYIVPSAVYSLTPADLATALTDIDLDHLIHTTFGASKPAVGSLIDQILNWSAGQTFDPATDSLEALRDLFRGIEAAGPYSYLDAGGEQTVYESNLVTRRRVSVEVSNRNMTQTGVFRLYRKVDGTNYDLWIKQAVAVGASDERAWDKDFVTNQAWKITYTEDVDEAAARAIPFNVITEVFE